MTFHFCNHPVPFKAFHGTVIILCGREKDHDGLHGCWTHTDGRHTKLNDDDVEMEHRK